MSWAIEEKVEDAILSYLQYQITGISGLNFYTAWNAELLKYPCIIVNAVRSKNIESTGWTGIREIDFEVVALVEAKNNVRNDIITLRDKMITAFADSDVATILNNRSPSNVIFSGVNIEEIERDIDDARRVLVNTIRLKVIATGK